MLKLPDNGASLLAKAFGVGFIDWLVRGVISSRTLTLKIPFSVSDFDLPDVSWIKRNLWMIADFTDGGMVHDSNILDNTTIAQCDCHDLVIHAGIGLSEQEFAPMFRQRGHIT
jgi:hypothetical protein